MSIVLSHPTGNANVRAAAAGLVDAELLYQFHTSLAVFSGGLLDWCSRSVPPLRELQRRRFDDRLAKLTITWPALETGRLLAGKLGWSSALTHETGRFSIDRVYQGFDRRVAAWLKRKTMDRPTGVYAYEDGALSTFQTARDLGIACYYDLPIGYWRAARRLLADEQAQWPEWAATLTGFRDSAAKLARKDQELALADRILVASSFTAKTLVDYPGKLAPVSVIPYGFPPVAEAVRKPTASNGKLRVLFVGGLSQRKGIANLFAAVETLKPWIELTVVGQKTGVDCPALDLALARHRWIPGLPHAQVLALMQTQDVLVFPSLFEGFGLVITEAMSQGTPVITTDRTAGPDIITHGQDGWLIQAGSTDALVQQLTQLIDNPVQVAATGSAARETARLRPWAVYGTELVAYLTGSPVLNA
nr:glycosyltransferase family 4 protein [uncultured Arsenicibacter sp.]